MFLALSGTPERPVEPACAHSFVAWTLRSRSQYAWQEGTRLGDRGRSGRVQTSGFEESKIGYKISGGANVQLLLPAVTFSRNSGQTLVNPHTWEKCNTQRRIGDIIARGRKFQWPARIALAGGF